MIKVLSKIFIQRFYARNTGFFLLLFYLLFGIVPGGQLLLYHYSLMMGIVSTGGFLLIALGVWLLYNLKCMWHMLGTINAQEYSFLYQTIGTVNTVRQRRSWLVVHIGIYAPALIYSLIAAVLAGFNGYYMALAVLLVFNALMCGLPVLLYSRLIQRPGAVLFYHKWIQWFNRRVHKPLPLYYIYELAASRTRRLLIVKVLSYLILMATFSLMDEYDVRVALTGLLIALLLHSVLVFEHRHFDDQYLAFTRHLPIPLWKRYATLCITYGCLLLPEFALLTVHTLRYNSWHWLLLGAFGASVLPLFRCLLYFPRLDQDKYLRWVFLIFCALLFMTLGYLYAWAVLCTQALAFALFAGRYYRYEPMYEQVQ
ncbi:MAG TPA: hypothetical protein VFS25_09890 [Chitinophaga sp.]|uniref:hypothetical protein n=1 Tax=Chitinophaga sp. TaxID=1869181 RepID=UPI002DBDD926|nr:hypothetical protein [Chitinophaga sp.]HEU4553137.1 hypothetical protein [Chitinophaga sp.]